MESFLLGGGGTNWQSPAQDEPVQQYQQYQRFSDDNVPTTPTKSNASESSSAVVPAATENKSNHSYSIAQSDVTHDSMVTVPLSGPPSLAIDTNIPVPVGPSWLGRNVETIEPVQQGVGAGAVAEQIDRNSVPNTDDAQDDTPKQRDVGRSLETELQESDENDAVDQNLNTPTPSTPTREASVNWDELQRTENEQPKDEQTETVSDLSNCWKIGINS